MESTIYSNQSASAETIKKNIRDLGDTSGNTRQKARAALIRIGEPAIPALGQALHSPDNLTRWGAAKVLVEIPSPRVAGELVDTLRNDEDPGIRWMASEAIIKLGREALVPLLEGIKDHFDCVWTLEGSRHVFHTFNKQGRLTDPLCKVMEALESTRAKIEAPKAAEDALELIQINGQELLLDEKPKE